MPAARLHLVVLYNDYEMLMVYMAQSFHNHRIGNRNKRRHTKEMPDSKNNDVNQN